MNKTEIKEKKERRKEILGVTAFLGALSFIIWIGSLGFYW